MAMPTQVQKVADIAKWYYDKHMPKGWYDAARTYQNYTFGRLVKDRVKRQLRGTSCSGNLMTGTNSNTVEDQMFTEDTFTRADLGTKFTFNWMMQKTHMLFDRREEVFQSRTLDGEVILDHLDMQKQAFYDGYFKHNEDALWTIPTAANNTGAAGKPFKMLGIPFHIMKAASAGDFSWGGLNPTDYADWGGIDRTSVATAANGTFTYTDVTHDDFCKGLSEAIDKTGFEPNDIPVSGEIVPTRNYELLSHYTPYQDYQTLAIASNDSLGPDMGKYRGSVKAKTQYFRSIPWSWVPAISLSGGAAEDSALPIYGLDWSTWSLEAADGFFMHLDPPVTRDTFHNTFVIWMDSIFQVVCNSPRTNFVGSYSA